MGETKMACVAGEVDDEEEEGAVPFDMADSDDDDDVTFFRFFNLSPPPHFAASPQRRTFLQPQAALPTAKMIVPSICDSNPPAARWGELAGRSDDFAIFQARFSGRAYVKRLRASLSADLKSNKTSGNVGIRKYLEMLQQVHDPTLTKDFNEVDAVIALVRFVRRCFPFDEDVAHVAMMHNFGKLLACGTKAWPPALVFGESRVAQYRLAQRDLLMSSSIAVQCAWIKAHKNDGGWFGADLLCTVPLTLNHAAEAAWMLQPWWGTLERKSRCACMMRFSTLGAFVAECGPRGSSPTALAPPWLRRLGGGQVGFLRKHDFAMHWLMRGIRSLQSGHAGMRQFMPTSAADRSAAISKELKPLWRDLFGRDVGPRVRLDPSQLHEMAAATHSPLATAPAPQRAPKDPTARTARAARPPPTARPSPAPRSLACAALSTSST